MRRMKLHRLLYVAVVVISVLSWATVPAAAQTDPGLEKPGPSLDWGDQNKVEGFYQIISEKTESQFWLPLYRWRDYPTIPPPNQSIFDKFDIINKLSTGITGWAQGFARTIWDIPRHLTSFATDFPLREWALRTAENRSRALYEALFMGGLNIVALAVGATLATILFRFFFKRNHSRSPFSELVEHLVFLAVPLTLLFFISTNLLSAPKAEDAFIKGSPAWLADKASDQIEKFANPILSKVVTTLVEPTAEGGKSPYSCHAYTNQLYDFYTRARENGPSMHQVVMSRIYETGFIQPMGAAVLGDGEIAAGIGCRWLEANGTLAPVRTIPSGTPILPPFEYGRRPPSEQLQAGIQCSAAGFKMFASDQALLDIHGSEDTLAKYGERCWSAEKAGTMSPSAFLTAATSDKAVAGMLSAHALCNELYLDSAVRRPRAWVLPFTDWHNEWSGPKDVSSLEAWAGRKDSDGSDTPRTYYDTNCKEFYAAADTEAATKNWRELTFSDAEPGSNLHRSAEGVLDEIYVKSGNMAPDVAAQISREEEFYASVSGGLQIEAIASSMMAVAAAIVVAYTTFGMLVGTGLSDLFLALMVLVLPATLLMLMLPQTRDVGKKFARMTVATLFIKTLTFVVLTFYLLLTSFLHGLLPTSPLTAVAVPLLAYIILRKLLQKINAEGIMTIRGSVATSIAAVKAAGESQRLSDLGGSFKDITDPSNRDWLSRNANRKLQMGRGIDTAKGAARAGGTLAKGAYKAASSGAKSKVVGSMLEKLGSGTKDDYRRELAQLAAKITQAGGMAANVLTQNWIGVAQNAASIMGNYAQKTMAEQQAALATKHDKSREEIAKYHYGTDGMRYMERVVADDVDDGKTYVGVNPFMASSMLNLLPSDVKSAFISLYEEAPQVAGHMQLSILDNWGELSFDENGELVFSDAPLREKIAEAARKRRVDPEKVLAEWQDAVDSGDAARLSAFYTEWAELLDAEFNMADFRNLKRVVEWEIAGRTKEGIAPTPNTDEIVEQVLATGPMIGDGDGFFTRQRKRAMFFGKQIFNSPEYWSEYGVEAAKQFMQGFEEAFGADSNVVEKFQGLTASFIEQMTDARRQWTDEEIVNALRGHNPGNAEDIRRRQEQRELIEVLGRLSENMAAARQEQTPVDGYVNVENWKQRNQAENK